MTTFVETLPARKSSAKSALQWRLTPDDWSSVAGVLTIHTDRQSADYTVTEFPTGWVNRGFVLTKVGGEGESVSYSVYCNPERPPVASCDCRGHATHLHCKHADALAALITNGWL